MQLEPIEIQGKIAMYPLIRLNHLHSITPLLLLILSLLSCAGKGPQLSPEQITQAKQLYEEGQRLYQGGYFIQASQAFRQAAEIGYPESQFQLAQMLYNGEGVYQRDSTEAAKWYQKAAEQGQVAAQYYLGALYKVGSGVSKDLIQAQYWFDKSAQQGYRDAQLSLGVNYFKGEGVDKDLQKAKYWLTQAAQQGSEEAATALREWGL